MTAAKDSPADGLSAPLVWDRAAMMERMLGDAALVDKIMGMALADLADQLQTLDRLLAAGDIPEIQRRAHAIKGVAASISAEALRAQASELEQAATAGDAGAIPQRLKALQAAYDRLHAFERR